jgi:hypothetical protein
VPQLLLVGLWRASGGRESAALGQGGASGRVRVRPETRICAFFGARIGVLSLIGLVSVRWTKPP